MSDKAGMGVFFEGKLVARCFKKHDFYKFLTESGVDWHKMLSKKLLPDDAMLVIVRETLFIIEVKYQQVGGSVDEKLQTCDFKRKQYLKLVANLGLKVEYVYVLNDWFKNPAYKDVLDYIHSVRMIRFAEVFPDPEIVSALLTQLGWTHFLSIIAIDDQLKRDFYAEMCRIERWSTRTLDKKIQSMLFERTALSRKPEKLAEIELKALREEDRMTPDLIFRDPYILDFLGLKDTYAEKDLEAAILREMEAFILELGVGFAFLERQKRVTVDGIDHYLDLLFYHRNLRRLVAIELKLGEFKPAHKGQMELYLGWLNRYERKPEEESPIGMILCAGKRHETVELLDLDKSGIHIASYWTEALPKAELELKLHDAVMLARARLERREGESRKRGLI